MLKDLQATIAGLFRREGDPLGAITPEQLKAVLKSIEGKYNALREDNRRLKSVVEEQRVALARSGETPKPAGEVQDQDRILALNSQVEELSLQRDAALRDRDAALARQDEAGHDREALLARIEALESAGSRVAQLESELAEANEARATALRLSDADAEKLALRAQLAELEDQLAAARGQQEQGGPGEAGQGFEAERARMERVRAELQDELMLTRQERDRLLTESSELRQERDRLLTESADADALASDAQAEAMQIADLKLQAIVGQKADLAEQLAVATRRNAELEDQLVSAGTRSTELAEQLDASSQEVVRLQAELASSRQPVSSPVLSPEAAPEPADHPAVDASSDASPLGELELAVPATTGSVAEREMLRAIAAIAEQVERLATSSPASSGHQPPKPAAVSSRSRPRPRKPASPDDPARKLDWLMGV